MRMRKNSTSKAIALIGTGAFLVAAFFGLKYLEATALPSGIALPTQPLENLPKVLGSNPEWTGSDSELNDEVFEAVDADKIVNREYRNALGNVISLHMPIFKNHSKPFTPHSPRHCYKGGGFEILNDDVRSIPIDEDTKLKVRFLTLERGTEHAQVLFWYQLGHRIVTNDPEMRRARWDERWQKKRAPVIKVLLETRGQNDILGEEQLVSLARPIYEWLRSVQPSEDAPGVEEDEPADRAETESPAETEDAATDAPATENE
jgi:EpsI family protein